MKKLYLVDVSGMIFRAFYAIRPLTNPQGLPTNALYGFLSMTVKLMREVRPDYMAFCFDRSEDTFRKEIDPRYKAHRKEMPEELRPQMPYFRKMGEALGIPCLDAAGFEADDIIGTLSKIGRDHGLEVVIVSGDKDFAQLVKPHLTMYDTMKDVRYDDAGVLEKWGVPPRQMIDFLSIVGDSSDNIPGIKGIGPKGAQALLSEYDTLEGIYENLDKIKSASTKKKLEEGRDEAVLSKRLVTIVCDMPLGVQPEDLRLKQVLRDDLAALLTELDFKGFAKTLLGETPAAAPVSEQSTVAAEASAVAKTVVDSLGPDHSPNGGMSRFVRPAPAQPAPERMTFNTGTIREDRMDLAALAKWLKPETETWALQTERGAYLAQSSGDGWTIAEVASHGPELNALLNEKHLIYKGFDIKAFSKNHLIDSPQVAWDQMLAAYVIRADKIETPHPLFTLYNGESLVELPSATQLLTAHLRLESQLRKKLQSIGGEKVLFEIEQPLVPLLAAMERKGIMIDKAMLAKQSEGLARDMAALEKEIHAETGGVFNIGSPKQLAQVLFEKMKMPPGKKTKTGYSTDNDVLEKLAKDYPVTAKVLQWRELTKLRSTYVEALPQLADKETSRVHTTFNQAWTATGRLSSMNPNLQNIPIRTERGNEIRKAFVAAPGKEFVSADYSQIELRILAHVANDEGLQRAFANDVDIHTATASEVFGVKLADVTPDMRRKAKAINFGLAYGQGAFGLAESLRIPRGEATEIINRYFAKFSGVKSYMTDVVEEAKKKGYVETVLGRRRYLDELFSKSPMIKKFGERAAINAPIQGTASDLVKLAMIAVGKKHGHEMLLQVHDELIFEVDKGRGSKECGEIASEMESVAQLKVPLKVNTGVGPNWDEAHS
ncbi:MAG TPA: DNA polymerase I [Bdellovibrionales bacterium]|nr:DNA polymerase I [Bdellovibrionales bacterium]